MRILVCVMGNWAKINDQTCSTFPLTVGALIFVAITLIDAPAIIDVNAAQKLVKAKENAVSTGSAEIASDMDLGTLWLGSMH